MPHEELPARHRLQNKLKLYKISFKAKVNFSCTFMLLDPNQIQQTNIMIYVICTLKMQQITDWITVVIYIDFTLNKFCNL